MTDTPTPPPEDDIDELHPVRPRIKPRDARSDTDIIAEAEKDLAHKATAEMVLKWDGEAAFYAGRRASDEKYTDKLMMEWREKIMKLSCPSLSSNLEDTHTFNSIVPSEDYLREDIHMMGDGVTMAELTARIASLMRMRYETMQDLKLARATATKETP